VTVSLNFDKTGNLLYNYKVYWYRFLFGLFIRGGMFGLLKNRISLLVVFAAFVFAACDTPMGMGPPVDTISPVISITSPRDGQYMRGILLGNSITIRGMVSDDMGVASLQFEIYDRTNARIVTPEKLNYEISSNGTWWAEVLMLDPGTADYRVTVTAFDKFKNKGAAQVDIRIDIIPPWVKEKKIIRHPNGFRFEADLFEIDHYRELNIIEGSGVNSHNDIPNANKDEFQNETFTVKISIDPAFSDVAASRLFVYDSEENLLNETGIAPYNSVVREPEYTITKEMIESWHGRYRTGPHYISFEVWAWSDAAWDPTLQRPIEGEAEQVQRIEGTCWFPESDYPHIYINSGDLFGNTITLEPDRLNALTVEFYDDDRLGEIYAGLVTEEKFNELRGAVNEEEYIRSLATDDAKRAAAIQWITAKSVDGDPQKESRFDTISLATGGAGEYRLIAISKDAKPTGGGYSFTDGEKWNVYPYRRVLVQSSSAPVIIVESPPAENQFPDLSPTGNSFNLSGYAISVSRNNYIQVAWLPNALQELTVNDAQNALRDAAAELVPGGMKVCDNGIKVWKLQIGEPVNEVINGTEYLKTTYNKAFDVVNDFIYETQNQGKDSKRLVIHSYNGVHAFKTFRLAGWNTGPSIEVTSHGLGAVHDLKSPLVLSMKVNPGSRNIGIKPGSIKILDITNDNTETGNVNEDLFSGGIILTNGEWQRTVPVEIVTEFSEGSTRKYRFQAEDILGNITTVERTITMSKLPVLIGITCSTGERSYRIGETLRFEARFTLPVRVDNSHSSPRLKLFFNDPGDNVNAATTIYARHEPSANGTTVIFTYMVQEGDNTEKLHTSLAPIDLNGSIFEPADGTEGDTKITFDDHSIGSLQTKQIVKIDGVRPKVDRASFVQVTENADSGATYFTNGKTVTLKLKMSEPVLVSGSPRAMITGQGITIPAEFSSIDQSDSSILYFTTSQLNVGSIASSQLRWGPSSYNSTAEYIRTGTGAALTDATADKITDTIGNLIDLSQDVISTDSSYYNGSQSDERAIIDTVKPNAPTISIHPTQANALSNINAINDVTVLTNKTVYLRVVGAEGGGTLKYSLNGGFTSLGYNSTTAQEIPDANSGSKLSSIYTPSEYSVTAYQTDFAGNESDHADARTVTINSRWPELVGMDINVPDGSYPAGQAITFRMNFSNRVQPQASASVTLNIAGIAVNATGTAVVTGTPTTEGNTYSTQLSVNWTVPNNLSNTMKNIKAQSITFTNVQDEYGNALGSYINDITTESAVVGPPPSSQRPIGDSNVTYTFQLNRPNVEIRSARPRVISASPQLPEASGQYYNGNTITANSGTRFTLTFDTSVSRVSGKYITIRPYGQWAIPPILSPEDFQALYNAITNASVNESTKETYRKRLSNIDIYGVPLIGSERGNPDAYNSYLETTHGVTDISTFVRPDTAAKRVLAFDIDPYQTAGTPDRTALLREVFNAVGWEQQRIPISQVAINDNVVTVTIGTLLPGRIWEVLLDDGAFQDTAGNPSVPITAQDVADGNTKYRFWSAGTAAPVIRVDRITYDGDRRDNVRRPVNIALGFLDASFNQKIPPIDTKVRIDCETPGASIRYDVIRTQFLPLAAAGDAVSVASAVTGGNINLNPVFGGTTGYTTDVTFFHDPVTALQITGAGTGTQGYQRNSIGSDGRNVPANKTNGFLNKLLVPITIQNGSGSLTNGAIPVTTLNTLATTVVNNTSSGTGSRVYRTYSNTGANSFGSYVSNNYVFIGDAFETTTNIAANHTDQRLYSGRRDYIVAAARKGLVDDSSSDNGKRFAGPQLAVSTANREGVYKTTMLYRNPGPNGTTGATQVVLDGRANVIYDGNLIPGFGVDDNPSGTDRYETNAYKTFYRVGTNASNTGADYNRDDPTNNHILVSWEIVADFRSRPAFYRRGGSGWGRAPDLGNNTGNTDGFTTGTYGGVLYRYHESFDN